MRRAAKYAGRAAHIPHGKAIYIGKDRAAAGRPREGTLSKSNLYQTAAYVTAFSVAEKFFGFLYRIILSRTLGAEGMVLDKNADIERVLSAAMSRGRPVVVDCRIVENEMVLPMIPPGKGMEDMIGSLSELEEN